MPLQVKHLMHRDVVKIHRDATVDELDRLLAEQDVTGVPVVDDDAKVVGIVSQSDIVRVISKEKRSSSFYDEGDAPRVARGTLTEELRQKKVSEIMERRVHSVWPDDDVAAAAGVMRRLGIHRVLVLDQGRASGILSSLDLIRVLEDLPYYEKYFGLMEGRKEGRVARRR